MALEDDILLFKEIPVFRLLEKDALRLLAFSAETKLLRAGDLVVRAPASLDGGLLLVKGSVAVFDNPDQIGAPRQIVRAPALIGELSMITQVETTGSIVAREPSTILRISRPTFYRVLAEYPESARALEHALLERIKATNADLAPLTAAISS